MEIPADLFVGQKFRVAVGTAYDEFSQDNENTFGGKIVTLEEIVGKQPCTLASFKCSFDEGQGLDEDLMGGVKWSFYRNELEAI